LLSTHITQKELKSTAMHAHLNIKKIINKQLNKNVPAIKITAHVSPYVIIKILPSKLVTCANTTF